MISTAIRCQQRKRATFTPINNHLEVNPGNYSTLLLHTKYGGRQDIQK